MFYQGPFGLTVGTLRKVLALVNLHVCACLLMLLGLTISVNLGYSSSTAHINQWTDIPDKKIVGQNLFMCVFMGKSVCVCVCVCVCVITG